MMIDYGKFTISTQTPYRVVNDFQLERTVRSALGIVNSELELDKLSTITSIIDNPFKVGFEVFMESYRKICEILVSSDVFIRLTLEIFFGRD